MAWWHRAVVGQKVVCIEDTWNEPPPRYSRIPTPRRGETYTIAAIAARPAIKCGIGLYLEEYYPNGYFTAANFRPVKDTSKQVEALKRLCNLTPEQKQLETAREGRS